ncbi:MAG: hypothetical protein KF838_00045 [Phycisphaeraceae bacterium]|nr:MAG: hypothetical protein KF838_00045 [Phycisphaeraceae bacterium]
MRRILLISGIATLLLGLVWWPLGIGEYATVTARVDAWYRSLVAQGVAKGETSGTSTMIQGLEQHMAKKRLWETAFLLGTGCLQTAACFCWRRIALTSGRLLLIIGAFTLLLCLALPAFGVGEMGVTGMLLHEGYTTLIELNIAEDDPSAVPALWSQFDHQITSHNLIRGLFLLTAGTIEIAAGVALLSVRKRTAPVPRAA